MYSPKAGLFIFFPPKGNMREKGLGAFLGCRNPDTFVLLKKVFFGGFMIIEVLSYHEIVTT